MHWDEDGLQFCGFGMSSSDRQFKTDLIVFWSTKPGDRLYIESYLYSEYLWLAFQTFVKYESSPAHFKPIKSEKYLSIILLITTR